eukprot:5258568-Pyramimonas_sp.AAC.1
MSCELCVESHVAQPVSCKLCGVICAAKLRYTSRTPCVQYQHRPAHETRGANKAPTGGHYARRRSTQQVRAAPTWFRAGNE